MRQLLLILTLTLGAAWLSPASASEDNFWTWLGPQLELADLQHPDIDRWEARYRRRHVELEIILQRGKDFLYPLAMAVRDRGMPMEIALLPIIESHLDPTAVSDQGARGLWQILPATAEHLGLEHDWWRDESADYLMSTRAALNYLDYLHDRFGGWLLALAAYNAGEGRIWNEMRKRNRRGEPFDLWNLDLPRQTEVYVPKLLALARILRDPRGVDLPPLTTRRSFTRLNTDGPLDVVQIAELARISVEQVYRLNPQLLRWSLPPQGPYTVYLPIESSASFRHALSQYPDHKRRHWNLHKVRSGENLSLIAKQYNSNVQLIEALNGLSSDTIKVGQNLVISDHEWGMDRATLDAARQRSRLAFAPRPLKDGYHQVAQGESLWTIARLYGTSVEQLRHHNDLNPRSHLVPGQLLRTGATDGRHKVYYTVRKGDALSLIAQRYKVRVRDIQAWNQLDDSLLKPGQTLELRLPANSG